MKLTLLFFLAAPAITVCIAACTGGGEELGSGDDEIKRATTTKVSGYDLGGPEVLASDRVSSEFCPDVLTREAAACEEARGTVKRANGCKDLCSVPIAPKGKAAGYDLTGFKQLASDRVGMEACTREITQEQLACRRANGSGAHANNCKDLCSVPIAPEGKTAGFDLRGFKILPSAPVGQVCLAVVSAVKEQCSKVGGKVSRADGCADLCSLPL